MIDIIDSISSIFMGLFIVTKRFIYASAIDAVAHSITDIPNVTLKLLFHEVMMFPAKYAAESMAMIISMIDNLDADVARIFVTA